MTQAIVKPLVPSETSAPRMVAVIDIGATSIRMALAEIHGDGSVKTLETLLQSVDLGCEVFANRRVSRKSVEKVVSVLLRYKQELSQYGIDEKNVRVVATTAMREAQNRVAVADRIYIATGLHVTTLDDAEVNRITYMGVMPHLSACPDLADGKSVVVEVGGGNTEMLIIRGGNVLHSQSVRLGSLRLLNTLEGVRLNDQRRRGLMESHIRRSLKQIVASIRKDSPIHLIALGGEMRFAARQLLEDWDGNSLVRVSTKQLADFAEQLMGLDENTIVKQYNASFVEAETVGPTLLAYKLLMEHFDLDHFYVCDTNLREGLIQDMAAGGSWTAEFRNQIIRSAISLGRKFAVDESHGRNVAELSKKLFEQLAAGHQLDNRHEVILYVAALLHEIGLIVNTRSNHKHALYLIRNSELFGLSRDELLQVGLVARYHRRASPQPSHDAYGTLPQSQRVVVSKLAAILRIAIALDDTRSGRVRDIRLHQEEHQLVIRVHGIDDVSLEQISMRDNSGLFRDVFGMPVILRAGA